MPSSFSPNLKIELLQTGENPGTWGTLTNNTLGNVIEQAITAQSVVPVADSATPTDLTSVNGTSVGDTARSLYIKLTGALTVTRTVQTVALKHFYIIQNATTGGQSISFISQAVGSVGLVIPNGTTALVYCDGTDVVSASSYMPFLNSAVITGGTINGAVIGGVTPASGTFTSLATGTINVTTGGSLTGVNLVSATGAFTSASITTATISGGTINGTAIGGTTPSTGTFTTLSSTGGALNGTIGVTTPNTGLFTNLTSSGLYTNTVVDGTAPMAITSTARVNNLNVARSGFSDQATVVDDISTAATFFPAFVGGVTGQRALTASSTKLTYTPSTGTLFATVLSGNSATLVTPLGIASGGTGTITGAPATRVVSAPSATSITPNADTTDILTQANSVSAGTLTINAPTGTPYNGQKIIFRITTTNSQNFAFNAIYQGSTDLALPSSMTAGTGNYLGFVYNSTTSKWQLLAKIFGFA